MFKPRLNTVLLCILPVSFAFAATASAQAPPSTPVQPPPTPAQVSAAPRAPLDPALPTVFVVGDSTARNQADLGWGDHFAHYFDTTRINVANRAIAGRSSRTFIREGAWDRVLAEMKPGDYVLLQMGHNDGGDLDGAKPRGSLKGLGDETKDVTLLNGQVETVHTYGWYMRKYIADTRAKNATPILLSLTIRNIWKDGPDGKPHIERDMGYDAQLRQLADEQHVAYVDMGTVEADRLEATGLEKAALLFPIDHTHTSAEGAEVNAQSVVQALRQANSPLVAYLAANPAPVAAKIGNQKVLVTEDSLAPGETAPLPGNRPAMLVFFGGSAAEYTTVQGDTRRGIVNRGETIFLANHEDSIKNLGSSKLSFVLTQFLTDGKPETWGMSGLAPNYTMILENQYARTYDIKIPAQGFEPQHTHHERIVICLSGAELEHILPNGEKQPSTLQSGEVAWRPAATHIGHNLGQTDLWVIAIEPK